ncbi:hypothetical protein [Fibrella aestuarina]|uniref:hypothetical protein n=1 Tax=Fibrella aestuarina TaxID=651143 RepID=UPI00030A04E6|nr:hypothetical protein [Fibrella aestuarina]
MHRSKDILILELFADTYKLYDELTLDLQTANFLDRVYGARKTETGLDYAKLLPPRPTGKFREVERVDFEFTKEKFPTLQHLIEYCKTVLLAEPKSYSRTRVEAWYHKCRHYYNANQSQPQTSPIVRPASAIVADLPPMDADNAQMVKNAQNAVAALQGKLNITPNMRRQ